MPNKFYKLVCLTGSTGVLIQGGLMRQDAAPNSAGVAELVDARGLGPRREICGGSSPSARTKHLNTSGRISELTTTDRDRLRPCRLQKQKMKA